MIEGPTEKANLDKAGEENTAGGSTRRRLFRFFRMLKRAARLPIAPSPDDSALTRPPRLRRLVAGLAARRLLPVYLALAVNGLLLAAYWWSAGGATTHVRIRAIDGVYTVFVDGKRQAEARCELFSGGSVIIRLPPENEVGSLPRPRGLDRLVVTDADSGTVLLDNDFSTVPDDGWTETVDHRYVLGVGDSSWHNYTVDAYFKNLTQASVMVHSTTDQNNGIVYVFRPFRHFDNGLNFLKDGKTGKCPVTWISAEAGGLKAVGDAGSPGLEMSKTETMKSMLAMLLRPYPLVALAVFGMLVAVVVLQLASLEKWLQRLRPPPASWWASVLIPLIAAAAFGVLVYISRNINQGVPHVPDEVSYLFQAKILASFHLTTPAPPVNDAFNFFYPSLLMDSGGRWASIYPFGHPVMLAIGQLVGAVWLIPPVLGALCIVLIYAVGRQIHSAQVGIVAAALLAFSPFFQMTASNLMSHNTAAFYILACLFLISVNWRSKSLAYGLAGVCFGLLLNTRPLTAAALVPPFALLFLYDPRAEACDCAEECGLRRWGHADGRRVLSVQPRHDGLAEPRLWKLGSIGGGRGLRREELGGPRDAERADPTGDAPNGHQRLAPLRRAGPRALALHARHPQPLGPLPPDRSGVHRRRVDSVRGERNNAWPPLLVRGDAVYHTLERKGLHPPGRESGLLGPADRP